MVSARIFKAITVMGNRSNTYTYYAVLQQQNSQTYGPFFGNS